MCLFGQAICDVSTARYECFAGVGQGVDPRAAGARRKPGNERPACPGRTRVTWDRCACLSVDAWKAVGAETRRALVPVPARRGAVCRSGSGQCCYTGDTGYRCAPGSAAACDGGRRCAVRKHRVVCITNVSGEPGYCARSTFWSQHSVLILSRIPMQRVDSACHRVGQRHCAKSARGSPHAITRTNPLRDCSGRAI